VARVRETGMHADSLVGKHVEKWSLGRMRRNWEDNINMDLRDRGCED
jgi:hypothetical protein